LDYRAVAGDVAAYVLEFAFQDVEVGGRDGFVFLDDDVAGAEEAEAFAEGDMHVEGDWGFGLVGFGVDSFEVVGAEGVVPDWGGGVAGVAGAWAVVAGEKGVAYAQFLAGLG
jgi:hypothetical protein